MKRSVSIFLAVIIFALPLFSCASRPSAHAAVSAFCEFFGGGGTVYFAEAGEGEAGYIDGNFFALMFGEEYSFSGDWSVWLASSLSSLCEAGAFVCDGSYDAALVSEMLRERLDLVRRISSVSSPHGTEGIILVFGNTVVYYIGDDCDGARGAWKNIF